MPEPHITETAPLSALRDALVIPGVSKSLRDDAASIGQAARATILQGVAAFSVSGNPDLLPQLEKHLADHITAICHLLAGERPRDSDLDFVRLHAHRHAEQKFPLDALLHSYRCLHQLLVPWIRDAALQTASESAHVRRVVAAVSEFTSEYIDSASTLMTSEYVDHTRQLAEAEGDRRTELLNMLLSGYDESDSRAAQVLRRAGYLEQRQSFCVAVARSVEAGEMANPARAQRMADAVSQIMRNMPLRTLVCVRDNLVTIVLSGKRRESGWTAPQSLLAERVYPQLRMLGPAAVIGLSSDAPSTSHIPRALTEAKLALEFASVGERVMPYSRIAFRQILLRVAREKIQHALPAWLDDFRVADTKSRGALSETLRAYADADMNALRTAKVLALHPNTIYARIQKVADITGKNALNYHALTELLLTTECANE